MFVTLTTKKGERIFVNVDKILFFGENKNGVVSLILTDGTTFDLGMLFEEIKIHLCALQIENSINLAKGAKGANE